MYRKLPNLIIGFHGCDKEIQEKVLSGQHRIANSVNDYDWLGHGQYFWENNYERALSWAEDNKKINKPSVIGAIIDLGKCLNLTDEKSIKELKNAYNLLNFDMKIVDKELPINKNIDGNTDLLVRKLDCAVIEYIHQINNETNELAYDSVRGVFIEGKEVYPTSGIKHKTHIQVCIVNPNCIKGYFRPIFRDDGWHMP